MKRRLTVDGRPYKSRASRWLERVELPLEPPGGRRVNPYEKPAAGAPAWTCPGALDVRREK